MNRRNILKWLGAAAYGLNISALAFQSTVEVSIVDAAHERPENSRVGSKKVACRIIGVGDAGCNIVLAAWSSGLLHAHDCQSDFACVSMGRQSIRDAISANRQNPWNAPIRPVQLGKYGAGGNVNVARAAVRKHDKTLRSLIDGADIVILVLGLGGGTGSAVGPALARMAMDTDALVLGVIVTPFRWELGSYSNAFQAVQSLEQHSHYLVSLPNEKMGELLGLDATLDDVIAHQEALASACLDRLLLDGSRFCVKSRSRPA
jgi:cell division protein FtsZ